MDRKQLIDKCLSARTDQEIQNALADLIRYRKANPDDIGILWCAEQMHMILTARGDDDS